MKTQQLTVFVTNVMAKNPREIIWAQEPWWLGEYGSESVLNVAEWNQVWSLGVFFNEIAFLPTQ